MLMEDIPYFAQLEGSAPPGAPAPPLTPLAVPPPAPTAPLQTQPPPSEPSVESEPPVEATDERLSRVLEDMPQSSELQRPGWDGPSLLMLDFPLPGATLEPDSKAATAAASAVAPATQASKA